MKSRPSKTREVKRRVFLLTEGLKTEALYLKALFRRRTSPEIFLFEKEGNEEGVTKGVVLAELALAYQDRIKNPKGTFEGLSYARLIRDLGLPEGFAKRLSEKGVDPKSPANAQTLERELWAYAEHGQPLSTVGMAFLALLEDDDFEIGYDKIGILVDRDAKSNPPKSYERMLSLCSGNGISLGVTNPCIEFWFLLHHENPKFDADKMKRNEKENGEGYAVLCLKVADPSYSKSSFDAEGYAKNFDAARKRAKKLGYTLPPEKLRDNLGTSIPLWVDEILGK